MTTVPQLQAAGTRFVVRVLRARWFSRAWCAHESRVATHGKRNNPLFLCYGPAPSSVASPAESSSTTKEAAAAVLDFEFRVIHYLALHMCSLPPVPSQEDEEEEEAPASRIPDLDELLDQQRLLDDPDPTRLWQLWYRIQRLMPERREETCSAMQHLVSILSFGCSFRGDLISIALNTSGLPLVFTGSGRVRSVGDAVWMFALLTIAAGDVVPLVMEGGKMRLELQGGGEVYDTAATQPLGAVNEEEKEEKKKTEEVISWSPLPKQAVLDSVLPLPDPSLITAVTAEYIELDLLLLTALPATPSSASQEKARSLIAEFGLDSVAELYSLAAGADVQRKSELMAAVISRIKQGAGGGPGPLAVFVQQWLAIGIECGLAWVLRFPGNMARATGDESGWEQGVLGVVDDETLLPAARALLGVLSGRRGDDDGGGRTQGREANRSGDGKGDIKNGSTTTTDASVDNDDETLRTAARFLRTILDPALKFFTAAPRLLPISGSSSSSPSSSTRSEEIDYAVTFSSSNRAYIAVPLAVAHLPERLTRAWVLEPFDAARDPPERPADFLPDPARTGIEPGEKLEDVYPVLSSDYADRRRPWVGATAWRLRRREAIFGGGRWDADALRDTLAAQGENGGGGEGLGQAHAVVLRRQRVYGAEDYDWGEILKAARRIEGPGGQPESDVPKAA